MKKLSGAVLVGLVVALAACGASPRRAEKAFARGDYRLAAQTYDELIADEPGNAEFKARRAEAVTKLHGVQLRTVLRLRQANDLEGVVRALGALLEGRQKWTPGAASLGDGQLDTSLALTLGWVREALTAELRAQVRARRLLGAEQRIDARSAQLPFPEFVELWAALDTELRTAAQATCAAHLPAEPEAFPFLTSLLLPYCEWFGAPVPAPPALGLASGVDVAVTIEGLAEPQIKAAQTAVAAAFLESPWYDPATPRQLRGLVSGLNEYRFTARPERLSADWTETIPYLATETYQESYTDYEHYTQQVPYTVHRTETYSCGSFKEHRTCTRSVPSTQYRMESRTRPVTKYRTATRTVTRYRDEPRVHYYNATRRSGDYEARWLTQLELELIPGATPFLFTEQAKVSQYGYDHDEVFEAAGVTPGRANLMTPDRWFDYVRGDLASKLGEQLSMKWQVSFCQLPSYSLETAARCARGSVPPPEARAALRQLFGDEVDLVLRRFTRWGERAAAQAKQRKPSKPSKAAR